jgi:hypothetical protein
MKQKLSQTISNLLHRKLHFGTRRQWWIGLTLVIALTFAFVAFTPGIQTAKWHLEHPSIVSCPSFTAHIPPLWTADRTNTLAACLYGLSIEKSTTRFGTMPRPPLFVDISPMTGPASFYSKPHTLQLLHKLYPGATPAPYRLNSTFTNCFLTPKSISLPNGKEINSTNVYCVDQKRKLTLQYNGSRRALPQVAGMIR